MEWHKMLDTIGFSIQKKLNSGRPKKLPFSPSGDFNRTSSYWIFKIMLELDGISVTSYSHIKECLSGSAFLQIFDKDIKDLQKRAERKLLQIKEGTMSSEVLKLSEEDGECIDFGLSGSAKKEFDDLFDDSDKEKFLNQLSVYVRRGRNKAVLAAALDKLIVFLEDEDFWEDLNVAERYKRTLNALGEDKLEAFPELLREYNKMEQEVSEHGLFSGKYARNLNFLKKCYALTEDEKNILGLLVLSFVDRSFHYALRFFDFSTGRQKMISEIIGKLLSIPSEKVESIFREKSSIAFMELVEENSGRYFDDFDDYFNFNFPGSASFIIDGTLSFNWFLKKFLRKESSSSLSLEDFSYLPQIQKVALPYLQSIGKKAPRGVNILLYGPPGTGKTQLSKLLASAAGFELFSPLDNGFAEKSSERFEQWKKANIFLQNNPRSAILIDEGDDFFNEGMYRGIRSDKNFINSELENNPRPTFWTMNSLRNIDASMIRRFHLVIEIPNPPKKYLYEIARNLFHDYLSEKNIVRIAETKNLSPAVLSQTADIALKIASTGLEVSEKCLMNSISDILGAQGFHKISQNTISESFFDPALTNADCNLESIVQGLRKVNSGRLCIYGPPGTGKTAFGKWIAKELGRPLILKKASDLLSCYVGMTEQLVAEAFEEAENQNAVLLIDEADSFLNSRSMAQQSWEVTRVNEFLTQMENFTGIFIATTNYMDILDEASLRRFDLTAKFDFVTPDQAKKLLAAYAKEANIGVTEAEFDTVAAMSYLTPGDFKSAVRRQNFTCSRSAASLLSALEKQVKAKEVSKSRIIGFSA